MRFSLNFNFNNGPHLRAFLFYNEDMSFLVSFNGQFKPYQYPEINRNLKLKPSNKVEPLKKENQQNDHAPKNEKQDLDNLKRFKRNSLLKSFNENADIRNESVPKYAYQLMTKTPICCHETTPFSEIHKIITKKQIHHLPVRDDEGKIIGIVSDRDLLPYVNDSINGKIPAKDIMSSGVITALENTRIQDIARVMLSENLSCLPIMNHNYYLTGIITKTDLLNFLARFFKEYWQA